MTNPQNAPVEAIAFIRDGHVFADSRDVARAFEKEHRRVLQTIRELDCSPEFRQHNFVPFKIKDLTGESTSHVDMTRDGFTFLAMGFTGSKAAAFKEKYIAAFNAMEEQLRQSPIPNLPDFSNPVVAARAWADAMEQKLALEGQVAHLKPRSDALARIEVADGAINFEQAAKALDIGRNDVGPTAHRYNFCYRRPGSDRWVPYKHAVDDGMMLMKVVEPRPGFATTQAFFTPRGLRWLAQLLDEEDGAA